jgi:prefoldin subunit 4
MIAPEDENNSEVRREDQDNINKFARLNARLHEVRREKSELGKELERLDDASTELMMGSGGSVMLFLGEAFFETKEDEATDFCEAEVDRTQAVLSRLEQEEREILARQAEIKTVLYGRFGKSINLEDESSEQEPQQR